MSIETLKVARIIALGSTSLLAMSVIMPSTAGAQSSSLPPVTIDAPKPRQAAPAAVRRAPAATTSRRVVRRTTPAPLQPVAPVAYVAPSTGTLGAPPRPMPADRSQPAAISAFSAVAAS